MICSFYQDDFQSGTSFERPPLQKANPLEMNVNLNMEVFISTLEERLLKDIFSIAKVIASTVIHDIKYELSIRMTFQHRIPRNTRQKSRTGIHYLTLAIFPRIIFKVHVPIDSSIHYPAF